jgi:membrane protein
MPDDAGALPHPVSEGRAWPRPLLRAWALFKRFRREVKEDDVLTLAAGFAYYLAFSLFPIALLAVTVLPYLPVPQLESHILDLLGQFMPKELLEILRRHVIRAVQERDPGLFTLGTVLAIWTSSSATRSAIKCLNRAYDVRETRRFWKVRVRAILLTLALAAFFLAALAIIAFGGPWLGHVRWPIAVVLGSLGAAFLYYFGPNVENQRFRWVTVGGLLATGVWVAGSQGVAYYVRSFKKFDEATGLIGVIMFFMLWFYFTGLCFLLGGEVNAILEQRSGGAVPPTPSAALEDPKA